MFKKNILFLLLAVLTYACGSDSETDLGTTDNFNRETLLINVADNIIIPAFQDFSDKLTALKTSSEAFNNNSNTTNLETLRSSWLQSYKAWQHVEMYDIGKAIDFGTDTRTGGTGFSAHFNVFPLTVATVESNISKGAYNFDEIPNYSAQGFPALDYLLYGVAADDTAIIEKYTTNANAVNYKKYITDIVDKMIAVNSQILNDWKDNFRDTFVTSTANTATSSLNKLINDFIFNYEKNFRAKKIGIPVGVFSSTSLPEKVEGFYTKDISKQLALEALMSIEKVFNGTSFNGNTSGIGFKNYLEELDRDDIANAITNQIAIARKQINGLNDNLYQQIIDNESNLLNVYSEIQKVVVLLKVDMLNAFNVSLDYADADGD